MKDIDLIKLLPELQPAVLHLDDHPGGEPMSRAVMVTYRLSTPPQRARIFDESDRPQGDLLSPTNFPAEGCHEIWVGNNLAGLCSLELTALQSKGETSFHLMLKATRDTDQTLSALAERIRVLTHRQKYRRVQYDQRLQAKKLQSGNRRYVDGMFTRHARLLVVRVNLYYRAAAQTRLRVEHVFRDLDELINELRYNAIFDHEIGYICAIEQGKYPGVRHEHGDEREGRYGRGFHAHVAFFFDGSKVRADVFKAMQIGELWQEITRGRGCYDSSNHNKEAKHGDRLGVGMIHRDDWARRERLYTVVDYLAKDDQHLRLKPAGARCLRKGMLGRHHRG